MEFRLVKNVEKDHQEFNFLVVVVLVLQANAIVGVDGAILAVDVITGGFGYQYPPIVRAIDECQYGSGATLSSELGELSETFVTFEDENDFEDYEICPDTTVG